MARLFDRIASGRWQQPAYATQQIDASSIYTQLEKSTVFVADDVAEFFFAGSDQEEWGPGDFPVVTPPFDTMWVEFRRPSIIRSEVFGMTPWPVDAPKAWGWLVVTDDLRSRGDQYAWTMNAYLFMQLNKAVVGPMYGRFWWVKPNGQLVTKEDDPRGSGVLAPTNDPALLQDMRRGSFYHPLLLTLSFMNCRNVARRTIEPPPRLSKKWEKAHGRPLVRYEVLDIDPMRKTLESEGGASTNGLKKALHICRGHFATYTDDAPLFGRVVGTFWKPQHVRGSAAAGAVVKDYNVKAPR